MANALSNEFKYQKQLGNIDMDANTFKVALMATAFTFNIDTHSNWSNVSASELAGVNGYTTGGATLAGVSVAKDDTNDRSNTTWNNVTWTASGGDIGPSPGAIIYKDTGTASTSTVVGFLDFTTDRTAANGAPFTILNPEVRDT